MDSLEECETLDFIHQGIGGACVQKDVSLCTFLNSQELVLLMWFEKNLGRLTTIYSAGMRCWVLKHNGMRSCRKGESQS